MNSLLSDSALLTGPEILFSHSVSFANTFINKPKVFSSFLSSHNWIQVFRIKALGHELIYISDTFLIFLREKVLSLASKLLLLTIHTLRSTKSILRIYLETLSQLFIPRVRHFRPVIPVLTFYFRLERLL